MCWLYSSLTTCIITLVLSVTQCVALWNQGGAWSNIGCICMAIMTFCFLKYIRKIDFCLSGEISMLKRSSKTVQQRRERPQVNNDTPNFIWKTKIANRCLIVNTQHISHNQRGPETVLLLQQKHQRTAQQLMWQNSRGRCGIHYISIQRCY